MALVDPATSPRSPFTGTISVALSGGDPTATLSGTKTKTASGRQRSTTSPLTASTETYASSPASGAADVSSADFDRAAVLSRGRGLLDLVHRRHGLSSKTITMNEFNPGGDTDTGVLTNRFITDPGWTATEGAGPGTLDCSYLDGTTYIEFTDFYSEYEYSNDERTGTIETTVKKKLFNELANNGASKLEVCFQAKLPFMLEDGITESPATAGEPGWFGPGLLPTCNKVDASVFPCIFQQNKVNGDAIVKASVPGPYTSTRGTGSVSASASRVRRHPERLRRGGSGRRTTPSEPRIDSRSLDMAFRAISSVPSSFTSASSVSARS